MYLNVKHTLKGPVDIATKFDYWYLNVKHTLKDPVLWETYFSSVDKIVNTVLQVSNGCYISTGSFIV
jgi:hypothetical protein